MSSLDAALEAVARHFHGSPERTDKGLAEAFLTIGGRRIAVEVTAIGPEAADGGDLTIPRLRFDKVALRVLDRLRTALSEVVPDGEAVIVTLTAPIRRPSKTAAEVERRIREHLARGSASADTDAAICGNKVRARFVNGLPRRMPKAYGYVHNPAADPRTLLDHAQAILRRIGAAAEKLSQRRIMDETWLVVVDPAGVVPIEVLRPIASELARSWAFTTILLVLAGGRVETLAG